MVLSSGTKLGPYEIQSAIAAGGMGVVYAAQDSRLHRKVAIKVLSEESTQQHDRVRRFQQEAEAASALNHPNILTIYEVGEIDGKQYIVTELVEGKTLREFLPTPMSLKKVLDIAVQASSALAAAHAAGIVHRDIKPENIMLRPDGYVKILDFGLAKLAEPPLGGKVDPDMPTVVNVSTEPGRIMGTWLYMSPEQVRGKELDARTDIWSLGVVIYELLTGHSPFAAATSTDTVVAIVGHEPPPFSQFGVQAPDELNRIVRKALAKDCEERYQSIKDMALDLKKLGQELELLTITRMTNVHTTVGQLPEIPKAKPSRRAAIFGAALVLVAATAFGLWSLLRPKPVLPPPSPARELSYSLTVQEMRNGKPYEDPFLSTAQEIFGGGWKFRFNFSSPQPGSLYLLDDSMGADGRRNLALMFPLPPSAGENVIGNRLSANTMLHTGWYFFDQHAGKDRVWIVWSAQPLDLLDKAAQEVAEKQNPAIADAAESANILALLARYSSPPPTTATDATLKQTTIKAPAAVMVDAVELEHH